ncbi:MAG TPA: tRNA (guanine-N7)-methyltransferase, partial [Propionibacteriaceae bacterium]|nr:tRNA (guanine-N7)-methyltransferase [Propionibacteriaceae bacterium]
MTESAVEHTELRARRKVVSFVRRSNRMRPNQSRAWEQHRDRFVLRVPRENTSTSIHPAASLNLAEAFGRAAELIVEIGPGTGESLIPMAEARPEANLLGFEVYRPAIARMLGHLARNGLDNVRIVEADAVAGLQRLLRPRS